MATLTLLGRAGHCHRNCHPTGWYGGDSRGTDGRHRSRKPLQIGTCRYWWGWPGTAHRALLNRYTLQRRIEGSNPSVSARNQFVQPGDMGNGLYVSVRRQVGDIVFLLSRVSVFADQPGLVAGQMLLTLVPDPLRRSVGNPHADRSKTSLEPFLSCRYAN